LPTTRSSAAITLLLVVMVVIWGVNYPVVKLALAAMPPLAFNGVRLILASGIFLLVIRHERRRHAAMVTAADWRRLLLLGLIGHCAYQLCFIGGLARTSVANSSLIIGCSPVTVALLTAALGHERLTRWHWIGCALSVVGIYLIVGRGAALGHATLAGDLLVVGATWCWTFYTVGSRSLLRRHSALFVTGVTMSAGTVMYLPFAAPHLIALDWAQLGWPIWLATAASAVFALFVAYLIWYTAVQQIGNARTSVYSNLIPVVAVASAAVWLGEPMDAGMAAGAAAILSGVFLTRLGHRPTASEEPANE
jgi:drug/metabolite transporter (DMT)-like permease